MNWLNKIIGKGDPANLPPEPVPAAEMVRQAGATVVRGGLNLPVLGTPGIRFQPNHNVTTDLQIKSLLGSGGMGDVYLARQQLWDVDVALKIPKDEILSDPENRHRIAREAEAWTDIGLHPHIAYCYYAQTVGDLLLLVIEYVDGGNLRDWIANGRCADLRTGLDLAIQFCHGLEHAHRKGLVHRDIKPENILLMHDGTLKITDFGIVRKGLTSSQSQASSGVGEPLATGMTLAGIGTVGYMAPEQWGDQSKIDPRADIFAFGICLYEMLCGARPYPITTGLRQEAPDPGRMRGTEELPERLCSLMKRCVDWDREARPASAEEVLAELCSVYEEVLGQPSLYAGLPQLTTQADDWNNRALSYVALDRIKDAERAWETALEADPKHTESVFNYGLHLWREAKITDTGLLLRLDELVTSDPSWLPRYLLAQVHMERGDAEGAKEALSGIEGDGANRSEVVAAVRAAAQLSVPGRLLRTLDDHNCFVSICMAADGKHALSASWDRTPRLWDLDTGRCVRTYEGHTGDLQSVSLSNVDQQFLSGGKDRTLRLWDVASGRCLKTFEGHTDKITSVHLADDGRYALSGSDDKTVKLWDVASGCCLRTFEGHDDIVYSVCLTPDGRQMLSGSNDGTLKLWDVESGQCQRTIEGDGGVKTVRLTADGRYAVYGGWWFTVNLVDLTSPETSRTFSGHTGFIESLCLSTDGKLAVSGSSDTTIKLWNVESGRCLRTFEGGSETVYAVCLSADETLVLSGSLDSLKLWQVGSFEYRAAFRLGRVVRTADAIVLAAKQEAALTRAARAFEAGDTVTARRYLRSAREDTRFRRAASTVQEWARLYVKLAHLGLADCWVQWSTQDAHPVCLSANGAYMLSVSKDKALNLWDVESWTCLRVFGEHASPVSSISLNADGTFALSGDWDGMLRLWDVETGRCLRTFEGHSDQVFSVCFSEDSRYALSGSCDKVHALFAFWDVESGRCLRTFETRAESWQASPACLTPDGRYALAGDSGGKLTLWDMGTATWLRTLGMDNRLRTLRAHEGPVTAICLSRDGGYALSGSWDNTVKLWDVGNGRCLRTFEGHREAVRSVCLSVDGRYALSGGCDHTVKLWDVAGGRCVRTLEHSGEVNWVSLTPDGRYAISNSNWGDIAVWFLDWDLKENQPMDWDEGARPCLGVFLRAHQPYELSSLPQDQPTADEIRRALRRQGRPVWTDEDFKSVLHTLGGAGYGWLRPEGVRRELDRMTALYERPVQWDEGARPHIKAFLRDNQPREGAPGWDEEDFDGLIYTLGCVGFGWLRPDDVRHELQRMIVLQQVMALVWRIAATRAIRQ